MITVLLIIHLMVASALVGLVLLQRSEGGALGIGGGSGGFMTGRGAGNLLTKATAGLAAAFFTTSLLLTILATRPNTSRSIFDTPAAAPAKSGTKTEPSAPATPTPGRGGVLDKLQPVQPSGPRVPQSK